MLVPYEELVSKPENVVRSLLQAMGFEDLMPAEISIATEAAKTHGDPVGRAMAIVKIKERPYLAELDKTRPGHVAEHCALLNRATLSHFVVPTDPARDYGADCDELP